MGLIFLSCKKQPQTHEPIMSRAGGDHPWPMGALDRWEWGQEYLSVYEVSDTMYNLVDLISGQSLDSSSTQPSSPPCDAVSQDISPVWPPDPKVPPSCPSRLTLASSGRLPLWHGLLQQPPRCLSCLQAYTPQLHPHSCQGNVSGSIYLAVTIPSALRDPL